MQNINKNKRELNVITNNNIAQYVNKRKYKSTVNKYIRGTIKRIDQLEKILSALPDKKTVKSRKEKKNIATVANNNAVQNNVNVINNAVQNNINVINNNNDVVNVNQTENKKINVQISEIIDDNIKYYSKVNNENVNIFLKNQIEISNIKNFKQRILKSHNIRDKKKLLNILIEIKKDRHVKYNPEEETDAEFERKKKCHEYANFTDFLNTLKSFYAIHEKVKSDDVVENSDEIVKKFKEFLNNYEIPKFESEKKYFKIMKKRGVKNAAFLNFLTKDIFNEIKKFLLNHKNLSINIDAGNAYYNCNIHTINQLVNILNIDEHKDFSKFFAFSSGRDLYQNIVNDKDVLFKFEIVRFDDVLHNKKNKGGFFDYILKDGIDINLESLQIYNKEQWENAEHNKNCLIFALEKLGLSEDKIKSLSNYINDMQVNVSDLNKICEHINISINLILVNGDKKNIKYGKNNDELYNVVLLENHFFQLCNFDFTTYSIEHYNELKHVENFHEISRNFIKNNKVYYQRNKKTIDSYTLVRTMLKHKNEFFEPIPMKLFDNANIDFDERHDIIDDLTFYNSECRNVKINNNNNEIYNDENIIFFDAITNDNKIVIELHTCSLEGTYKNIKMRDDNDNTCYNFMRKLKNDTLLLTYSKENCIEFIKKMNNTSQISNDFICYKGSIKNYENVLINVKILNVKNFITQTNPKDYDALFNIKKYDNLASQMAHGFSLLRENFLNEFKINIFNHISINSLLKEYLNDNNCFNNVFELSGTPQNFINRCVIGPRCQTLNNDSHIIDNIISIDANSLYSSSINQLTGFLQGLPNVLNQEQLNYDFLKQQTYYYVKIHVREVNKKLTYPMYKENDDYTNDFVNKEIYADKNTLEDYINHHKIEFDILQGYYFNDGFNNKIVDINNILLQKRNENKENKDKELIYKLLLNSIYGMTLAKKSIANFKHITGKNNLDTYIARNNNNVYKYEEIGGCNDDKYKKYLVVEKKTLNNGKGSFNLVHIGCSILSGAKQIMNRVFTTAQDKNINIYYTDTDSIFIKKTDLNNLQNAYIEKYDKPLINKGFGFFKVEMNGNDYKAVFIAKKKYIMQNDKKDVDNDVNMKIRCAGLNSDDIIRHCDENNISAYDLFKQRVLSFDEIDIRTYSNKKTICKSNFELQDNENLYYKF